MPDYLLDMARFDMLGLSLMSSDFNVSLIYFVISIIQGILLEWSKKDLVSYMLLYVFIQMKGKSSFKTST